MTDESAQPADSLEEQLVAYLDGELDAEVAHRIETLLTADQKARKTLHDLEHTWDLLDSLDIPMSNEKLTQSTMTMVALAARKEVDEALAAAPRRRHRRWAIAIGSLAFAVIAGFLFVWATVPDPNRQLLDDLPILEHFDEYRRVSSIDFLRMLCEHHLFSEKNPDLFYYEFFEKEKTEPTEHTIAQARQQIERMTPSEKEQLLETEQKFNAMELSERQRMRQLHTAIESDPNAQQLQLTMRQYCQWLRALPAYGRAELAELDDPADRIKWIEDRLAEQARKMELRLGARDSDTVLQWINEHIAKQEAAFLQSLPAAHRAKVREMSQAMRRYLLLCQMLQWRPNGNSISPPTMTAADLENLRKKLSPEVQETLQNKPDTEQWQLVMAWTRLAVRRQLAGKQSHERVFKADDEHLADFFENGINATDRDRLLNLSGDEMQQELLRLYLARANSSEEGEEQ
jgi:hypothetical protein